MIPRHILRPTVNRPFRTAAPYYACYRPGYPPELIALLVDATDVTRADRVLDLGCGPGSLAIPLARYAGEVVAVDAEPEMIAEIDEAAPTNLRAVVARAEEVDESWGAFQLAVAGRSFHWFDAAVVLENLARITPVIALCADDHQDSQAQSLALKIANRFLDPSPPRAPLRRYADILSQSAFSNVETITVEVERRWTADELIGFVYSTSSASPERLGSRQDEFEKQLRIEAAGTYSERVPVDAVIGRLPLR
jgi:SAM-dependent methyltransferase